MNAGGLEASPKYYYSEVLPLEKLNLDCRSRLSKQADLDCLNYGTRLHQ